jgi:ATP-dependent helicase HrpB
MTRGEVLPIEGIRGEFCAAMRRCNRVIVTAPTGSGKSTRIPGWIVDEALAGGGKVVVVQPRRLAARMLASRVARDRGVDLGGVVG